MAQVRKVIHVEFKQPIDGRKHYYFGSKAAIYSYFDASHVGIAYNTLRLEGNLTDKPYENDKCIIRQGELLAKTKDDE